MERKTTVSFGIPAHNEEHNIVNLVNKLLELKSTKFNVEKIIVINDGSEDNTQNKLNELKKNSKVQIITHEKRKGKNITLNEINETCESDYLINLDADVIINDKDFIDNLLNPFTTDSKIGLVAGKVKSIDGKGLIEKVISFSQTEKTKTLEKLTGHDVHLCHGRVRAFSKNLYKNLNYPKDIIADDAYSYFKCISLGYKFFYTNNAFIIYRSPTTIIDYIKQNKRFIAGKKQIEIHFDKNSVDKEYRLEPKVFAKSLLNSLKKNSFLTILYIMLLVFSSISKKSKDNTYLWKTVTTSKKVGL